MRKLTQSEFLDKISEVAFMIEKDKENLRQNLYKTHPASIHFFNSLKELAFHEPSEDVFEKLLVSAENAVLAFFILAKESPLKKTITKDDYESYLKKNKDDFASIANKDILDKTMIESFLLKSNQPAIFTLLYITFPKIAENDWDKSIAFLIFLRVKAFLDCLSNAY